MASGCCRGFTRRRHKRECSTECGIERRGVGAHSLLQCMPLAVYLHHFCHETCYQMLVVVGEPRAENKETRECRKSLAAHPD